MRRLLLAADLIGLVIAYLVALELASPCPGADDRQSRSDLGDRPLRGEPRAVGPPGEHVGSVRPRRGAHGSFDRRRHGRRGPGCHYRDGGAFLSPWPRTSPDLRIRNSGSSSCSGGSPIALVPSSGRSRARMGRRNSAYLQNAIIVGSGRWPPDRGQDREPSGVRTAHRRLRRSRRSCRPIGEQPLDLLGGTEDLPGLVQATRCTVSRSPSRLTRTSTRSP